VDRDTSKHLSTILTPRSFIGKERRPRTNARQGVTAVGCLARTPEDGPIEDRTKFQLDDPEASKFNTWSQIGLDGSERLGCSAENWHNRMQRLNGDRLLGRFFAVNRAKLREIGERLGVRHVVNLAGCPTR
jgi:hypothetical protein